MMKISTYIFIGSLSLNAAWATGILPHINILTDFQLNRSNEEAVTETLETLEQMADSCAQKYDVDPMLFRSLIEQESGWKISVRSNKGASGLTQIMPATALSECNLSEEDILDPAKNLDCGAYYFSKQLNKFKRVDLALAAYNAGPTRVARSMNVPNITETKKYVRSILAIHKRLKGVE